jgi:DNA-binding NarL/FixJ family response regulator
LKRPRVLLADDHTLVVEGLKKLLEPDFELAGTAQDGFALLEAAQKLKPDAILLDISMPLLNGIEACRRLKRVLPKAKIVMLTMHADRTYLAEAFRAGASGYLLKRSAVSELVFAIHEVLRGRFYVTPLVAKDMVHTFLDQSQPPHSHAPGFESPNLTERQREILQLVAEGRANKEIAVILRIAVKTVEFHKSQIMRRLDIHTTAELTKYAIAHGIVEV